MSRSKHRCRDNRLWLFLAALLMGLGGSVEAQNSRRSVVEGLLIPDSVSAFARDVSEVREVEFRSSLGAAGYANVIVRKMGDTIRERGISTFARGVCASACADLFLMGQRMSLLTSYTKTPTYLLIHPFFNSKTHEINYSDSDSTFKKIANKANGKITFKFLEKTYDVKNSRGGIYIFRDPFLTIRGRYSVLFCDGTELFQPRTCSPIENLTPQLLGIDIEN